jgi:hypothetical protein
MENKNRALCLVAGSEMPFGPARATQSLGRCIALAHRSSALARSSFCEVLKGCRLRFYKSHGSRTSLV